MRKQKLTLKTKGYKMLNLQNETIKQYKSWLQAKGYSLFTANQKPSTIFDYITGILWVARWEHKTIEELRDSISEILPRYTIGDCSVKGRMKSRSVRCGLRQFNKFILETQAA